MWHWSFGFRSFYCFQYCQTGKVHIIQQNWGHYKGKEEWCIQLNQHEYERKTKMLVKRKVTNRKELYNLGIISGNSLSWLLNCKFNQTGRNLCPLIVQHLSQTGLWSLWSDAPADCTAAIQLKTCRSQVILPLLCAPEQNTNQTRNKQHSPFLFSAQQATEQIASGLLKQHYFPWHLLITNVSWNTFCVISI